MPWLTLLGIAATAGCSDSDAATAAGSTPTGGAAGSAGESVGGATGEVGGASSTGGVTLGPAITGLPARTWTWVPFAEAHCRDGSSTGIGVNANPDSDRLMIFLAGGGACFNAATCGLTTSAFNEDNFRALLDDIASGVGTGIFDRNDLTSPVKDWNFVAVPYCTGDVHAGNNPDGSISGAGAQQFVGYANLGLYLQRIVPTFPGVVQVLLTGVSAGGFGAFANYDQVTRYFDSVPVVMLDDSGPLMDAPYLADCLAQQFRAQWGLDRTLLVDCGADCPDSSHYLMDFARHIVRRHPSVPFALVDSTADQVITMFFGFGANDCTAFASLSEATFTAGLEDIRTKLAEYTNFGAFVFSGAAHGSLHTAAFGTLAVSDTTLKDYVAALLNGQVSNVGP